MTAHPIARTLRRPVRAALVLSTCFAALLVGCTPPATPAPPSTSAPATESVAQAATVATVRWTDVSFRGARPSATSSYAVAWDSARDRLMVYGGLRPTGRHNEVWEYDGADWQFFNMNGDWPGARTSPVWVYDPVGHRTLLFGGTQQTTINPPSETVYDDLWSWDGASWELLTQGSVRPQRLQARLGVFDTERNRLIVFGGFSELGGANPELVWEWDPTTGDWSSLTATAIGGLGVVPRSVVWDSSRHRVIGLTSSEAYDAQLAVWDPNAERWSPLLGSGMDAIVFDSPALAYRPETDTVLIWGDGLAYSYNLTTSTIEVFPPELIGSAPAIDHAPREVAPIVYDEANQRMLSLWEGGLFALDGTGWHNVTPGGTDHISPSRRRGYAVATHTGRESVLLFGGRNQEQAALNILMPGTWEWDGALWQRRPSAVEPPPRMLHDMAYHPAADQVVLFGGEDADGTCLADTWVWSDGAWSDVTSTVGDQPLPSRDHAMAWDPTSGMVLMFGGRNCDNTAKETRSDLWGWDGMAWQRVTATGMPPAGRHGHDMTTTDTGLALVGGSDWTVPTNLGEVWTFANGAWTFVRATQTGTGGPAWSGAASWDSTDHNLLYFHDQVVDALRGNQWFTVRDNASEQNASLFGLARMWPANGGLQSAHEVAEVPWLGAHLYWNWENFTSRTVLWDGTWREVTPALSTIPVDVPVPQVAEPEFIGAWDPMRDKVVLYRLPLSASVPGRTWVYDVPAATWTETTPEWRDVAYLDTLAGFPDVRRGASMVWDGRELRIMNGEGDFTEDTSAGTINWKYNWDTGAWNRINPGDYPIRTYASVVSRGGPDVVFFGGRDTSGQMLADTWRCDHNVFPRDCTTFPADPAPAGRARHAMAWDSDDDVFLMFGGVNAANTHLTDTWLLDDTGWRQIEGNYCAPAPRTRHAMAYAPAAHAFVLYGGLAKRGAAAPRAASDAWVFDLDTERWSLNPPERPLPPRFGHTMLTTTDGKVLALSGAGTGAAPHETLSLDVSVAPLDLAPASLETTEEVPFTLTLEPSILPAGAAFVLPNLPEGASWDEATTTLTWTPTHAQIGTHALIVAAEGDGFCVDDTLVIEVIPFVNAPPVAEDQAVGTTRNAPVTFDLLATDADGHALAYRLLSQPISGEAALDGATVTYTPAVDVIGEDVFTWATNDGFDDSNTGTVTITVRPTNTAPLIADQDVTTPEDTPLTIDPAIIDPDTEDTHTIHVDTSPDHGEITINGTDILYTPAPDYAGPDRFVITVNDGTEDSAPATITIDVTPVNDPPVANDLQTNTEANTAIDILLAANDVEGDDLSFTLVDAPEHGQVTLTDNLARYTPDDDYTGADRFTFSVSDGEGLSDEGTVTLTVVPNDGGGDDNHPPVLAPLDALTVVAGEPLTLQLVASDADGDTLTFSVQGAGDDATLDAATGAFTWTPTDADVRTWQLTFTVTDGQDADSTTVSVEVTPSGDTNNTLKAGTESPGCDCSTTQGRPSSMLWLLAALGLGWALRSRPESYGRR